MNIFSYEMAKSAFLVEQSNQKYQSSIFYFEIHRAPSELLLPIAKKSAQKDWIGLAG